MDADIDSHNVAMTHENPKVQGLKNCHGPTSTGEVSEVTMT